MTVHYAGTAKTLVVVQ